MKLAVEPDMIAAPEPVQQKVLQLARGFRKIEELAQEIATLEFVTQDVRRTQAAIRRDTANAVLQTAFSLKQCKTATSSPAELRERLEPAADLGTTDVWAKKLLRWADQFGRDLFGFASVRERQKKENATTLPAPKG